MYTTDVVLESAVILLVGNSLSRREEIANAPLTVLAKTSENFSFVQ